MWRARKYFQTKNRTRAKITTSPITRGKKAHTHIAIRTPGEYITIDRATATHSRQVDNRASAVAVCAHSCCSQKRCREVQKKRSESFGVGYIQRVSVAAAAALSVARERLLYSSSLSLPLLQTL